MGSVTWLLVPAALLGGVPFPPPVYYSLSALKEAATSLEATTASPCPKEKFVSTYILDSPPRHSRSSTAVASATVAPTTNLGNPRSFFPTFGEMPEEAHARTDPSPAFVSSQKRMQAKREVKTTKQRYWKSLSSAFATTLLKKETATAWGRRRVTEAAGFERRMGSINSLEKSFLPETTAVGRREVLFLRERLTRRHDGHAKTTRTTTHAFLRPKGLVETSPASTATTNKTILDVNEHQATPASSDTDDMRVADVLMQRLRTASGREGSLGFERVRDFDTRQVHRELTEEAVARHTSETMSRNVGISTAGGSVLAQNSGTVRDVQPVGIVSGGGITGNAEIFTGANVQSAATGAEVSSAQKSAAETSLEAAGGSSPARGPLSPLGANGITPTRRISEAMREFTATRETPINNKAELKGISEVDEMVSTVSQPVPSSQGYLSTDYSLLEDRGIFKPVGVSFITAHANVLNYTTMNITDKRESFELSARPREISRKSRHLLSRHVDYRAAESEEILHKITGFIKALTKLNKRIDEAGRGFNRHSDKAKTVDRSVVPNRTRLETTPPKGVYFGGMVSEGSSTATKFSVALTLSGPPSNDDHEQTSNDGGNVGHHARRLARHPRAAESLTVVSTSTSSSGHPRALPRTGREFIPVKKLIEREDKNGSDLLSTPVLPYGSDTQTTYGESTTGMGNAVLVAETNDLTSSMRPQTADPIQPSKLPGNAVPTSTRVPYLLVGLPTTHQPVEVSADPVSSEGEDTRDVEVHENLYTESPQLLAPGNDEATEPLRTGPESTSSTPSTTWTAWSTSAYDVPDNSDETQVSSAEGMHQSGTSASHGLTPEEETSAAPMFTEKIRQPDSLPVTSADMPITKREISDVTTTSTQTSPAEVRSTNEARVISQSEPPDQDTTTEESMTYTTSSLKSRETVVTTPGDVASVTTDPGRPLSSANSSNPLAGGLPKPGIDPKETGRRQPKVMPSTEPPEAYPSVNGVRVRLGLDADYGACVRGREWQFREHIRRQLSVLLRVPLPGVRNVRVLPGSIIVEADMVPVKTPLLEVDRSALLAARLDLQDRIDKGTVVVTDLDGNRLPIFTRTVYSLQPPRGSSYSPALLGALTVMFFGATSVIVASAYLVRRHVGEGHVSPSPEAQADVEQPPVDERPFLRLASPGLLISTRLDDPATASILRDARMLPRRSLVPDPPVYKPARDEVDAPEPVSSLQPRTEPSESGVTWQSHPFDSSVTPSDAFSLATWSSTPFQPSPSVDTQTLGSETTSRWTASPSGRTVWNPESRLGSAPNSIATNQKARANGHVR